LLLLVFYSLPAVAQDYFTDDRGRPNAWFWVTGAATMAADQPLYDLVQKADSPATHRAAVIFNSFGDGRVQAGTLALLAIGGSADRRISRRGLHGAVASGLLVLLLKETTRKARPYANRGPVYGVRPLTAEAGAAGTPDNAGEPGALQQDMKGDTPYRMDSVKSFPSGHTAAAFSLATVWAHERPRDRELVYALAVLTGLSRISLKQHWPSDVFWGAAIGIAAGNAANRDVPFGLMFRVR